MQELFTAAQVTISLAFLLYASWSDYKTREVSNRVWAVYAPLAVILSLADFLIYDSSRLPLFGLSFGVTAAIAILLFYTGGFGGADSKALMCIALALPFSTEALIAPLLPNGVSPLAQNLFPLTVFSNAVLFAAASCVYLLLYNLVWHKKTGRKIFEGTLANESAMKKFVALITGRRVSISQLKAKWHVYPMEDLEDENGENPPKRKLVMVPKDEGRDEIVMRLSNAVDAGKIDSYVWATPGLPMLIFVTIGLVVALLFGDIVWVLINSVLG
jgi:archaeal preflagellin peptidase FlaK